MRAGCLHAVVMLVLLLVLAGPRPLGASPGQEFAVREAGVALRAQPNGTADEVLSLTPEHRLVEFARQGDWVRVGVYRQVGAFGWVPVDQLVAVPRPVPATAPPQPEPLPEWEVPPLVMEITGTPAVEIRGTCTLLGPPGADRTVALASHIPKAYRFIAAAVDCQIRKFDFIGRMRIRLYRGDTLLAGRRTSGPFNLLWIRSDGPWGGARAVLRGGLATGGGPLRD